MLRHIKYVIIVLHLSVNAYGQTKADSEIAVIKSFSRDLFINNGDSILTLFNIKEIPSYASIDSLGYNYFSWSQDKHVLKDLAFTFQFLFKADSLISWGVTPYFVQATYSINDRDVEPHKLEHSQRREKEISHYLLKSGWKRYYFDWQPVVFQFASSSKPRKMYADNYLPKYREVMDTLMSVFTDKFYKQDLYTKHHKKFKLQDLEYLLYSIDPFTRALAVRSLTCGKLKPSEEMKVVVADVIKNSPRVKTRHGCVVSRESIVPFMLDCE